MAKEHKQVYSGSRLVLENLSGDVGKFQVDVNGNLVVTGNLNILGDLESTDVTQSTLQIDDKSIILNRGEQGPGVGAVPGTAPLSGLVIDRGMYEQTGTDDNGEPIYEFRDSPYTPATILWNEVIQAWALNTDLNSLDLDGDPNTSVTWQDRFTWTDPRLVNVGNPEGDHRTSELETDPLLRGTAANVGFVADITNPIEQNIDDLEEYLNTAQSKTNNHIMYWRSQGGLNYGGQWETEELRIFYDKSPALGGNVDVNGYTLNYYGNYQDNSETSSRATTYSTLYLGHTDGEDPTYANTTLWAETDITIESNTTLVDVIAGSEIQLTAPTVDVNASTTFTLDTPLADVNATTFDLDGTTGTVNFSNLTTTASTEYQLDTPLADINATTLDVDGTSATFDYTASFAITSPTTTVSAGTELQIDTPLADVNATTLTVDGTTGTVTYDNLTLNVNTELQVDTPLADINATTFDLDGTNVFVDATTEIQATAPTVDVNATTTFTLDTPLADLNITTVDLDGTDFTSTVSGAFTVNGTGDAVISPAGSVTINDYVMPSADGTTAGQALITDGAGTTSFSDVVNEAAKLETARNIEVSGAVTGSALFDGTADINIVTTATSDPTLTLDGDTTGSATFTNLGNATLTVTVLDDSHNHTTATINNYVEDTQDVVGGMVTGNTENGITVTYDDGAGKLNFDVLDPVLSLSGDVSGSATMTNLSDTDIVVTVADDSHQHTTSTIINYVEDTQDVVGGMVSGNTESGIAVTYDDANGKLNFNVNDPVITLDGDVSGSATMTNLGNTTITVTVIDDSHNHIIANVDGLQAALDSKADDSTQIIAGTHLSGGGTLGTNTTLNVNPDTNTYIVDSQGNNRLYFGSDVNTQQFTFRFSATGDFQWMNSAGTVVATVDSSGNATFNNITADGSSLSNINANDITAGTLSDARLPNTITSDITGNAATATALQTARNISLGGELSGTASFDGTSNITITATVDNFVERAQDAAGAMVSGNTENGITVTYDDAANKLNFDVNDPTITLNGDVSGSATMTNLGNVTINTTVANNSHTHTSANITDLTENVQDIVGGMVSGNTENGIAVTYNDTNGTLNFDVNDPTITISGAVTGSATMTNLGNINISTTATSDPTLTMSGDISGSATFTNLGNATLNAVVNSFANNATNDFGNMAFFVNDGGGNLGIRFNATAGSTNSLVENGQAYEIEIGNDSNGGDFNIFRGTTSSGTAGDTITWNSAFTIDGSTGQIIAANGFSGNGSALTSLNASNITSGTISDARLPGTISSNITGNAATATNADQLDSLNSTQFLRSDQSDSTSGNLTVVGYLQTDEVRNRSGNGIVVNVGESASQPTTSQTAEVLYVNSENGIEVNASPDNWASGWAGRVTTLINSNGIDTEGVYSGNGSGITNINASNLSTGTVPDARLPNTISSDITGNAATASRVVASGLLTGTSTDVVSGTAGNDGFAIAFGTTSGVDDGYLDIYTRDNGNEPIYVSQYSSGSLNRRATLLASNGSTTFPGQVTASSFNTSSALKYKENIEQFDRALEKVMQIDIIYYTNKDGEDKERKIGVTADSVAKVAPEFVDFVDGEPDSVNYGQMTAMLIRAIQEQEERRLVNRIKKLVGIIKGWFVK